MINLNIFIDCRMLFASGIGRYTKEILKQIFYFQDDLQFTLAGEPFIISSYLEEYPDLKKAVKKIVNFNTPIYSAIEHLYGSLLLQKYIGNNLVFHFPHYDVPWMLPKNSVVTIHDLIHFRFPNYYNRTKVKLAHFVLENALKKACKIIVISRSTANDLEKMFPFVELRGKTHLIYNGVSSFFEPQPAHKVGLFKKIKGLDNYLLFVGNRKPHKNLDRLLKAYKEVKKEFGDLQLVVAGKIFGQEDELTQLKKKTNLHDIVEIEEVTDQDLLYLYCGAKALVLPSLYEGFGLPLVEAMACGTPVVASNVASLPEVVGDAGVYVNPYDVEDITRGIYKILSDENLRVYLQDKCLLRSKLFTWKKTAQETLSVYQEVLLNQGR
jgi:glycosyltransferase involved in cell wall biosynthesis